MKIAIDIDDVLADFVTSLCRFHNDKYGTSLTRENFHSYRVSEVWGGTDEEAISKIFEFHDSRYFRDIAPVDGSIEAINNLSKRFDLAVLTSRHRKFEPETVEWLETYFHGAFTNKIYFSHNSYADFGNTKRKSDFCMEINIAFLIEDSLEYAKECRRTGTRVYLFDRPWNRKEEPTGITRVKNWQEIMEYFK